MFVYFGLRLLPKLAMLDFNVCLSKTIQFQSSKRLGPLRNQFESLWVGP